MHAKCEVSISYGSKAIVKVKVDNRQTNKQTGQRSKIEKVPRGIRGEKSSKDMASSRNLVSTRMFLLVFYPTPTPILRLNIAYFAVAEGWLLLDIG